MSNTTSLPQPVIDLLPHIPPEIRVWLVGGAVRDILLGRQTTDFDFVVEGNALNLARRLADELSGAYYPLDRERGIGRILLLSSDAKRYTLDISDMRGGTIETDLRGRDFTANALAVLLEPPYEWIDPMHGVKDIKERVLRLCNTTALLDDPVRSLRAVRLSVGLSFRLAKETIQHMRHVSPLIQTVSIERVRDEIMLLLDLPRPGAAIRLLNHMDFLPHIFPELKALREDQPAGTEAMSGIDNTLTLLDRLAELLVVLADVYNPDQTGNVIMAQASLRLGRYRAHLIAHLDRPLTHWHRARQILFLAALYHRVGAIRDPSLLGEKGMQDKTALSADLVGARARALRLSNAEADLAANIVRCHRAPDGFDETQPVDPRAIYRFFRSAKEAGVEAVLIWLANYLAASGISLLQPVWTGKLDLARALFQAYFEDRDLLVNPRSLVDGLDLMHILRLEPGPQVGRLLELVREAQVAGEVTTREQAVAFLRSISNEEHGSGADMTNT